MNLFLEIFGECQIFKDNLDEIIKVKSIRLNWEVLPPGEIPWGRLREELFPFIKKIPQIKQKAIEERFKILNSYNPSLHAYGKAGFRGYTVFGFEKKKLFFLESIYTGNATYIFGIDWKELSKKTKAEILSEKLHEDRIIHSDNWKSRIGDIFG